jgi:hypothetical protein
MRGYGYGNGYAAGAGYAAGVWVRRILFALYVLIGLVVASDHHYLSHVSTLKGVLQAILAVVLWPLVLLGVSMHL